MMMSGSKEEGKNLTNISSIFIPSVLEESFLTTMIYTFFFFFFSFSLSFFLSLPFPFLLPYIKKYIYIYDLTPKKEGTKNVPQKKGGA